MIRGLKRLLRECFYDGKETLSITRVMIAAVFAQVFAIVWLTVFWVRYLTLTGQMESGALLMRAALEPVAAILGTQVAGAAFSYFIQNKFGSGGIAGRQLDISEKRDAAVAGEAPVPVPDVAYLVPSDPDEPRVAAESAATDAELPAAPTGSLDTDDAGMDRP